VRPQFWRNDKRFENLHKNPAELQRLQAAVAYFQYFDQDKSGQLDKQEFASLHADLVKNNMTTHDLESCFEELDTDGSGAFMCVVSCSVSCSVVSLVVSCSVSLAHRRWPRHDFVQRVRRVDLVRAGAQGQGPASTFGLSSGRAGARRAPRSCSKISFA
jgi:hypothetical protein